jgi:uncharacterized protein
MRAVLPLLSVMGLAVACDPGSASDDAADPVLTPAMVQGSGPQSPYAGQAITVRGVVSGDFQDNDADVTSSLGGFYLQNETADRDPATSDGLFVFDRHANGPDIRVGDRVEVRGTVSERFGETQLAAEELTVTGTAKITVTELELPAAAVATNSDGIPIADLEAYEGMLVRIPQALYVQDLFGLERYGEITLSVVERQHKFTSLNRPDPAGYEANEQERASQMLLLDDGQVQQGITPIRYVKGDAAPAFALRVGDAVEELTGVLRYSRGSGANGLETWRIMPTAKPRFVQHNPRPALPAVGGTLRVASFNVLNYFATIDSGVPACGPAGVDDCRGADSREELTRQRAKTATAIKALQADVVGLMELENNERASIDHLLSALNGADGDWRAVNTGVIGQDAIRVALIYRASRVELAGAHALLDRQVDPRFNDERNRPVLAQSFRAPGNGTVFTVAVSHLKSKGSPCDEDGDPDRGDGQGNCSRTRTLAAEALGTWLASDPTGSGSDLSLAIGDFNAYMNEDPVRALEAQGYVNLLREHVGETAWSFVYRAESGALDHAFASAALAAKVSGIAEWHINADEAPLYDYNLEFARDSQLFDASLPWRAADHDPLLIGLQLP